MKRGVRNARATRQWPQNGGDGPQPRVDFNKMKVSGLSRADLPALTVLRRWELSRLLLRGVFGITYMESEVNSSLSAPYDRGFCTQS